MTKRRNAAKRELDRLQKKRRGTLRAADVVEFARDPKTALHNYFTWDDTEAAERYRIIQARRVIRVFVTIEAQEARPVRTYVSLMQDRARPGGGYRSTASVMRSTRLRSALLQQALDELNATRMRYTAIKELATVWGEVDKATAEHGAGDAIPEIAHAAN